MSNIRVLYFQSDWCAPCHALHAAVEEIERGGVSVVRVDVDAMPQMAEQYGVQGVPTLVVKRGLDVLDWISPADARPGTLVDRVMAWAE